MVRVLLSGRGPAPRARSGTSGGGCSMPSTSTASWLPCRFCIGEATARGLDTRRRTVTPTELQRCRESPGSLVAKTRSRPRGGPLRTRGDLGLDARRGLRVKTLSERGTAVASDQRSRAVVMFVRDREWRIDPVAGVLETTDFSVTPCVVWRPRGRRSRSACSRLRGRT